MKTNTESIVVWDMGDRPKVIEDGQLLEVTDGRQTVEGVIKIHFRENDVLIRLLQNSTIEVATLVVQDGSVVRSSVH